MDRPRYRPSLAAIGRLFPTPIERVVADVLVDHALVDVLAFLIFAMPRENHLPVGEGAYEVEVAALVVDPCLLPLVEGRVVHGNADAMQPRCSAAVELFLDDAIVEDFANGVTAMSYFVGLGARPCSVPFPDPEVELAKLGLGATSRRGRLLG